MYGPTGRQIAFLFSISFALGVALGILFALVGCLIIFGLS